MLQRLLLSLFLMAFVTISHAQIRSFSKKPEVFITELNTHMKSASRTDVSQQADLFLKNWNEGLWDETEKKTIRDFCEEMMLKRLSVHPHYAMYITSLNHALSGGLEKKVIQQFFDISKTLLGVNQREFTSFLETTIPLFSENVLYDRQQMKWYADNNRFELLLQGGKLAIRFKYATLTCKAFLDKMEIFDTEGTYFPERDMWEGKNGRVYWTRVGLDKEDASCKLNTYNIKMSSASYTAEGVYMRFPKYFAGDVLGRLEDKVSFTTTEERIENNKYPRFMSAKSNVKVPGIVGKKAEYVGGFGLHGNIITGNNIAGDPVSITLFYKDKPQMILRAKAFNIQNDIASSLKTELIILIDSNKTIYHPSVEIRYDFEKGEIRINKGKEGLMQMSFQNDYHMVDIDVERIVWNQSNPHIEFDNPSSDKPAYVESGDFFNMYRFEKVQGMLSYNPLSRLREYSLSRRIRKFSIKDYAAHYKSNPDNMRSLLIDLADDGYIYYDNVNDSIEVRNKLFNYVNNQLKARDYDVIRMSSVISARPNVTYNINNKTLLVEGVRMFVISDSQNCVAVPHEQKVLIRKGRDMSFGGVVRAGKLDFYSRDFNFKYDDFKVVNTQFDSLVLYYPDPMTERLRKVQSVLSDLYGTLEFDHPRNKSGLKKKDHPDYPIFTSERGSKIHYEHSFTHQYAYKKDVFYFEVDPFRITNLNDFDAKDLKFPGTFVSADIFPDFKHEVTIQSDFSLGFITHVSKPMYQNRGKGDMYLSLSNQGLYGTGTIQYLGSVSKSNSFLLLPKETRGLSDEFDLPASGNYPLVTAKKSNTRWLPYEDKMLQTQSDEPFKVFEMKYEFAGTLTLSPEHLSGNGKLHWDEADFYSMNMVYGRKEVKADTSSIEIFSVTPDVFAFKADNLKSHLDFNTRIGHMQTNQEGDMTYMPVNKYSTTLSDYQWKMDKKRMEMRPNPKFTSIEPSFLSNDWQQDSLRFESRFADFDLANSVIYVEKIPHIDLADSRVFLKDGKATIRANANIDRLDSTTIIANRVDEYHKIKHALTKINGRNNFRSSGKYEYKNALGELQTIFMDSIRVNREKRVVGVGKIQDTTDFYLDKKIAYKGWAKIESHEEPMNFFGFMRPELKFDFVRQQWVKMVGQMDINDMVFEATNPRNIDDRPLSTGLFVAQDSAHIYPMLFGAKARYSDPEVTTDTGVLFYDKESGDLVIGARKKLFEKADKGNVIRFNDDKKTIYAEGAFSLDLNIKSGIKSGFAGSTLWNQQTDSTYYFDWTFFMDFPLPKETVQRMVELAKEEQYGTKANINTEALQRNIHEFYAKEKDAKTISDNLKNTGNLNSDNKIATLGFVKLLGRKKEKEKEVFDTKLYFSDIEKRGAEKAQFFVSASRWYFDQKSNAFVCNGEVELASINGANINKRFNALFVVDKKKSGDDIHIYISFYQNEWVYFNYVRGVMYAWSNDKTFNSSIIEKGEKISSRDYKLRRGTPRNVEKLLRRFE